MLARQPSAYRHIAASRRPLMSSVVHHQLAAWILVVLASSTLAKETPEQVAAQEAFRASIPLGGNFTPQPEEGVFIAAGHSMNVVASRDDGRTWQPVFYGQPCGDHGRWAVWNSVAYSEGVFAIAAGWGAPGTILASDDGVHWRHLTDGQREPARKDSQPYDMLTTMELLGVDGSFVLPMEATPDFGRTWYRTSPYGFRDTNGERVKVNLAHPSLACGTVTSRDPANRVVETKRILVIGDDGPAVFSDDLGKTWTPLKVTVTPWDGKGAQGIIAKRDVFLIVKGDGQTVLRSVDGGLSWTAHPLGVIKPASRSFCLSIVGDEFWVTGETSKASSDGIHWRDLPDNTPSGRIAASESGTLINVSRKRHSILRSADQGRSWQEVYTFEPSSDATGGAQGLADVAFGQVKRIR